VDARHGAESRGHVQGDGRPPPPNLADRPSSCRNVAHNARGRQDESQPAGATQRPQEPRDVVGSAHARDNGLDTCGCVGSRPGRCRCSALRARAFRQGLELFVSARRRTLARLPATRAEERDLRRLVVGEVSAPSRLLGRQPRSLTLNASGMIATCSVLTLQRRRLSDGSF
jgi:hypothetical protein